MKGYAAGAATLALAGAAALIAVFILTGPGPSANAVQPGSRIGALGPGWSPTVAQPLPPSAKQVSFADASRALGAPVMLPDSATVSPSDVGAVWMASAGDPATGESSVAVAVTFPSQSLAIRYQRPAYSDPLSNYENFVRAYPDGDKVVYLNGVPALVQTTTRADGSSWSAVEFVRGGTIIGVMGSATESTLEGVARSIVSQTNSS